MKETIAACQYYETAVDKEKNRMYSTLIGLWPSKAAVPNYVEDIKKAEKWLDKDS